MGLFKKEKEKNAPKQTTRAEGFESPEKSFFETPLRQASSKPEFGFQGDFGTFLRVFLSGNAENGSWFKHVAEWRARAARKLFFARLARRKKKE